MSQVRYKAIRRRSIGRRQQPSDEDKLKAIRALYIVVYNDVQSLIPLSTELFHLLGDILEGKPLVDLELHRVNKERVLTAFADLANK